MTVALYCTAVNNGNVGGLCGIPVCCLAKVQQHGRRAGGVGVTLHSATLGRCQLHINAVAVKMYAVISCLALLALVAEHGVYPKWCVCLSQWQCHGQETYIIQVASSRTAKVCVAESCNGAVGVEVSRNPVPTGLAVVGAQLYHSKGSLCSWIYVALAVGTYEWVYQ